MGEKFEGYDRNTLSVKVVERIREAILSGKYKVGDSLTEVKLAEELGVSRTPVREALRQLELEDLVESSPNRGSVVKGLSHQDIGDIYTIRMLLEGQAAHWACERASKAEIDRLSEIVELMDLYTRRSDMEQLARLDTDFHDIIYNACKSRVLKRTLTSLHHNISFARLSNYQKPTRAQKSLEEHRAICEAFENRNCALAAKLVSAHVESANNIIKALYEENS